MDVIILLQHTIDSERILSFQTQGGRRFPVSAVLRPRLRINLQLITICEHWN